MKPGYVVRAVGLFIACLFVLPLVIIFATSVSESSIIYFPPQGFSLHWYKVIFTDDEWINGIFTSLSVALRASIIAAFMGTVLALGAARGRGLIPKGMTAGLAVSPIVVPLVVAGIGFYIGSIQIGLNGDEFALVLAHSVIGIPFVFVNVLAALTKVDRNAEEAARVCGSNEAGVFARITLPLIFPATIVGGILAFIMSWDEVIIAQFLTSPTFQTLPVLIYADVRTGADPSTSAVASFATGASMLLIGLIMVTVWARKLFSQWRRVTALERRTK